MFVVTLCYLLGIFVEFLLCTLRLTCLFYISLLHETDSKLQGLRSLLGHMPYLNWSTYCTHKSFDTLHFNNLIR